MLLVNGFRPIPKYSNNNGINKQQSNPVQFKLNSDTTTFTAITKLPPKSQEALDEITNKIIKKNQDVLGKNFKKNFLNPVSAFLSEHGVSIQHRNVGNGDIRVSGYHLSTGKVENCCKSTLVRTGDIPIHSEGVRTITESFSDFELIKKFNNKDKELEIYDFNNPLIGIEFPKEIKQKITKIENALDEFAIKWYNARFNVDNSPNQHDLKALAKQEGYKALMPLD